MKLLSNYPVNESMQAADGCQYCSAIYSVTVLDVDAETQIGTISSGLIHDPECPDRFEEFEDPYSGDLDVAEASTEGIIDIAGWTFHNYSVKVFGGEFPAIASRANVGPCLNCWKLIVSVPLSLFSEEHNYQLDFCHDCADRLGIFKTLLAGP